MQSCAEVREPIEMPLRVVSKVGQDGGPLAPRERGGLGVSLPLV